MWCKLLLRENAAVEPRDNSNRTPLHLVATNGHDVVVALLIDAGVSPGALDIDKKTPLHISYLEGQHTVVKLLLQSVSETKDTQDQTPNRAKSAILRS